MWPLLKISEAITYDSLYPANFSKSLLSRSFSFTQIPFPLATDQIRTSLVVQAVKKLPAMQETQVWSLVGKIPWRRKWQLTPVFFPRESHGQKTLLATVRGLQRGRHDWVTDAFTLATLYFPILSPFLSFFLLLFSPVFKGLRQQF